MLENYVLSLAIYDLIKEMVRVTLLVSFKFKGWKQTTDTERKCKGMSKQRTNTFDGGGWEGLERM